MRLRSKSICALARRFGNLGPFHRLRDEKSTELLGRLR